MVWRRGNTYHALSNEVRSYSAVFCSECAPLNLAENTCLEFVAHAGLEVKPFTPTCFAMEVTGVFTVCQVASATSIYLFKQ